MELINGINGVYDTEAKRYIYGADPVPPAASVSEDIGKKNKKVRHRTIPLLTAQRLRRRKS